VTTVAVPTAAVAAVVGDNCNNGNDSSGIDGSSDDGGCGDGECDCRSGGNGNSDGSGKAMKTMVATAMTVGGKYNNQLKGQGRW
jgi:hypothetical protein